MTCVVEGCGQMDPPGRLGFCMKHYKRWYRHGDPNVVKVGVKPSKGWWFSEYKHIMMKDENGKLTYEHILIAEKALGRKLPKGAIVHHVNEKPWDNTPTNLVICPDQAYHRLLHQRTKEYNDAHSADSATDADNS